MRSRKKVGAAIAAATVAGWCGLFALLAAGCGGDGGPLTMRDYAREARAVCIRADRLAEKVVNLAPRDVPVSARAAARIVVIRRETLADVRALHAPDQLVDAVPPWLALVDQALDELDAMVVELGLGNPARAYDDWKQAAILTDRARVLAPPLRLSSCAFDVEALAPNAIGPARPVRSSDLARLMVP